jgi:hypothetical protein
MSRLFLSRSGGWKRPLRLRRGTHAGNHFTIVVSRLDGLPTPELRQRVAAIETALRECGWPNFYGQQRFGSRGNCLRQGWRTLLGTAAAADTQEGGSGRERKRKRKRERGQQRGSSGHGFVATLHINGLQSLIFNLVLAERMRSSGGVPAPCARTAGARACCLFVCFLETGVVLIWHRTIPVSAAPPPLCFSLFSSLSPSLPRARGRGGQAHASMTHRLACVRQAPRPLRQPTTTARGRGSARRCQRRPVMPAPRSSVPYCRCATGCH